MLHSGWPMPIHPRDPHAPFPPPIIPLFARPAHYRPRRPMATSLYPYLSSVATAPRLSRAPLIPRPDWSTSTHLSIPFVLLRKFLFRPPLTAPHDQQLASQILPIRSVNSHSIQPYHLLSPSAVNVEQRLESPDLPQLMLSSIGNPLRFDCSPVPFCPVGHSSPVLISGPTPLYSD